ncbi:hypothetical protein [Ruegeria sp. EL01]|uniref:hypothetical protein n=1 Tax=Ruegeria sp. EL01 TaxID=2107578 RepID=UPI0013C50604|nr:hypothetical protein [Ruegeria sp. EL01]
MFRTVFSSDPKATPASATHGKSHRSESPAHPVTSVRFNEYGRASEGASFPPHAGKRPQTLNRAFERLNAPQMRRDSLYDALPPVWLMLIAAATCLITLLAADTLYSSFFLWMTGVSL